MVDVVSSACRCDFVLSVLALSSRFDGHGRMQRAILYLYLSVLALSSRFDGRAAPAPQNTCGAAFSTRSVESF